MISLACERGSSLYISSSTYKVCLIVDYRCFQPHSKLCSVSTLSSSMRSSFCSSETNSVNNFLSIGVITPFFVRFSRCRWIAPIITTSFQLGSCFGVKIMSKFSLKFLNPSKRNSAFELSFLWSEQLEEECTTNLSCILSRILCSGENRSYAFWLFSLTLLISLTMSKSRWSLNIAFSLRLVSRINLLKDSFLRQQLLNLVIIGYIGYTTKAINLSLISHLKFFLVKNILSVILSRSSLVIGSSSASFRLRSFKQPLL